MLPYQRGSVVRLPGCFAAVRLGACAGLFAVVFSPFTPNAFAVEPGKSLDPTLIHDADDVVGFLIDEAVAERESEPNFDMDHDPYQRAAIEAPAEQGYILAPFVRRAHRGVVEITTSFTSPANKPSIEMKLVFPNAGKEAEAAIGAIPEIREIEIRAKADKSSKAASGRMEQAFVTTPSGGSELIMGLGNRSFLVLSSTAQVSREVLSSLAQKIPVEQLRDSSSKN